MVVGVVLPVFCVQNETWRAVCGVGAADMHRLCFPIATYSMYMGMGGGAGGTPVARLGGCGLCMCVSSFTPALGGGHWAHKLVLVWVTACTHMCCDHVHV